MAKTWITPEVKDRLSKMSRAELDAEIAKLNKLIGDTPKKNKPQPKKKESGFSKVRKKRKNLALKK